jgi:hypothetical protein
VLWILRISKFRCLKVPFLKSFEILPFKFQRPVFMTADLHKDGTILCLGSCMENRAKSLFNSVYSIIFRIQKYNKSTPIQISIQNGEMNNSLGVFHSRTNLVVVVWGPETKLYTQNLEIWNLNVNEFLISKIPPDMCMTFFIT